MDLSNLNRQYFAKNEDIGKFKFVISATHKGSVRKFIDIFCKFFSISKNL